MNSQNNQLTEKVTESNQHPVDKPISETPQDHRQWIEKPRTGRLLGEFAKDLGRIAATTGDFYSRDGVPGRIFAGRFDQISPAAMRTAIETFSVPFEMKKGRGTPPDELPTPVPNSITKDQAAACLECGEFVSQLRPLFATSPIPIPVYRDGKIALVSGYDEKTEIYAMGGFTLDLMPLKAASDYLRDLLSEFPFADDDGRSLSVHISAMISRFAASLIPQSSQIPLVIFNANGPAAGKSLLAQMVEIPVKGCAAIRSMPGEQEELQKVLDSELLACSSSIIFDNVKVTKLDSAYLEQFATSSVVAVRKLNSSNKYEMRKQTMIMFTMNQTAVSADIARRSIFCDLFQREADPQKRRITKPIDAHWLSRKENRFSILSALWSLVSAWDKEGRPPGSGRLAGFEDWGRIIGGIVENAGFGSPLRRPVGEYLGDPDQQDMRDLVQCMAAGIYRDAIEMPCRDGVTINDLIWICRDQGLFAEIIEGRTDRETKEFEIYGKSRTKISLLFAKYNGRVFQFDSIGSVKFERMGGKNDRKWRVS
jgi:hypothetical protein